MKMIPLLFCFNMQEAIFFYTQVLDFKLKDANASANDWVVDLINGQAEIQLTSLTGDQLPGLAVNVQVQQIDELFEKYRSRGLNPPLNKQASPVHQGPVDQTWGMREFYVTDPSGNTLRFREPIPE